MLFNFTFLPENLKMKKSNLRRIGFPRIENVDFPILLNKRSLRKYIKENMVDMEDSKLSKGTMNSTEFIVDISDSHHHKLEIKLQKNNTRAEEQRKLRSQIINKEKAEGTYESRIDKNILILYLDNISRAHFYRKMPKTVEWLSQFIDDEESNFTTYQYFKYHSQYFATNSSWAGLFFGEYRSVNSGSSNVFNSYSKNGYITGSVTEICDYTEAELSSKWVTGVNRWDHLGVPMACDPNYDIIEDGSLNWFKGPQSGLRH